MVRQLTLVIHALHTGGAERVLARLANHWAEAEVDVTLITLDAVASDALPLHSRIRRIGLDTMRTSQSRWQALRNNLQRVRRLRRAIRQAGAPCVVSFTDKMNVLTLLACVGLGVDVVLAERSHPRHQKLSPGWERLRRWTYPRCWALVVQTASVARAARALVDPQRIHVIPNAVPEDLALSAPAEPRDARRIVALGRLSHEKGFDLLLDAFARVAAQHPDWTLEILGDGEQRAHLERQLVDLQLQTRVRLAGWVESPLRRLQAAGLFVLPSRYEGFPNALLEAMACGLPVVSFACESGPQEIIRHEVDGVLVPPADVPALAAALGRLMSEAATRERLGRRAVEVVSRFSEREFFQRWDAVLTGLAPTPIPLPPDIPARS